MSDIRKDLLRKMAALRQTIDPTLLDRTKLAMFGKVPYDREGAKEAVSCFLDARHDGGAFRRKLEQALKQEDAKGATATDAPSKDGSSPPKPRRTGRIA